MNLTAPSPRRRPARGLRAGPLALVLMLTTTLSLVAGLPSARADDSTREPPAHPAAIPSAPPHHPDSAHVLNGCYISTIAYIARFLAEFPGEQATPLTLAPRNLENRHTITLLSWQGRWWGRDEYLGVFPLGCAVENAATLEQLISKAERAVERLFASKSNSGIRPTDTVARDEAPAKQRAEAVAVARQVLPCQSEQFWIQGGGQEIPLLFFRPAPGRIAVYDPLSGTASAECPSPDAAKIVKVVATRLGYRVDEVRPDFNHLAGTRLAAAGPLAGGNAR